MNRQKAWLIIFLFAFLMGIGSLGGLFFTAPLLLENVRFRDPIYQLDYKTYFDIEEGKYYLFLPSYASLDCMIEILPSGVDVSYSCNSIDYGNGFNNLPLGTDIEVTLQTVVDLLK